MSLCKQNKHKTHVGKKKNKARVAKARAAKKNLSESILSGGALGVNACMCKCIPVL